MTTAVQTMPRVRVVTSVPAYASRMELGTVLVHHGPVSTSVDLEAKGPVRKSGTAETDCGRAQIS